MNLFRMSLFCFLVVFLCAACGDDETPAEAGDNGGPGDLTHSDMGVGEVDGLDDLVEQGDVDAAPAGDPPSFRSVLVTIEGELSSEADLNNDDAVRILPETFPAEFRCFVQDDGSVEDLLVQVVDGGEEDFAVPEQSAELSNGLWKIYLDISPGMTLSVHVEDLDGHVVFSPNSLVLPTQQEAVVDHWVDRFYETNQQIRTVWNNDYLDSGQWNQDQVDTGVERGGTYHFDDPLGLGGDILTVEERHRAMSGEDDDDDEETVEWAVTGSYYTDETYFSHNPFYREGDGETEVGTWTRQVLEIQHDESGLVEVVSERNETLTLNDDDSWSESWTGFEMVDGEQVTFSEERSGTYDIELNDDYTESIGNFLARQVETLNGEAVPSEEGVLFELYVVKLDRFLISPLLRLE